MLRLKIEERHMWAGPGNAVFTQRSEEIARILEMGIPAAIVVQLPRRGTGLAFNQAYTDILLYFPRRSQVIVYDATYNDPRRAIGLDMRSYGSYSGYTSLDGTKEPEVKRYQYAVEFSPFLHLHSGNCPDKCLCAFHIKCDTMDYVELLITYDHEGRSNETVTVNWCEDGSPTKITKVATWHHDLDSESKILTWNTSPPVKSDPRVDAVLAEISNPLRSYKYPPAKQIPHICGYHREG
jgi:hypothetical protein